MLTKVTLLGGVVLALWASISAHATTIVLGFSDGDGGGFVEPLTSLEGLKSVIVSIDFVASANGTPVTSTAGIFNIQTRIDASSEVLGISLPSSSLTQDQGNYSFDPAQDEFINLDAPAHTTINYTFTKADIARVLASVPVIGSTNYFHDGYPVSVAALDLSTNTVVGYVFAQNDVSSLGTLTIVTDAVPEPAAFGLVGVGVIGLALRRR